MKNAEILKSMQESLNIDSAVYRIVWNAEHTFEVLAYHQTTHA